MILVRKPVRYGFGLGVYGWARVCLWKWVEAKRPVSEHRLYNRCPVEGA